MNLDMVYLECWVCGIPFAISESFHATVRAKKLVLYCPKGCRLGLGKSLLEEAKEQYIEAERRLQARLNEANHARLVAVKGAKAALQQKRKLERRIAHGVCPCCNQTFADLSNHMVTEHKDFRLPEGKKTKQITA